MRIDDGTPGGGHHDLTDAPGASSIRGLLHDEWVAVDAINPQEERLGSVRIREDRPRNGARPNLEFRGLLRDNHAVVVGEPVRHLQRGSHAVNVRADVLNVGDGRRLEIPRETSMHQVTHPPVHRTGSKHVSSEHTMGTGAEGIGTHDPSRDWRNAGPDPLDFPANVDRVERNSGTSMNLEGPVGDGTALIVIGIAE